MLSTTKIDFEHVLDTVSSLIQGLSYARLTARTVVVVVVDVLFVLGLFV